MIGIIPWPREVTLTGGWFELDAETTIWAPGLEALAERLRAELAAATGLSLADAPPARRQLRLSLDPSLPGGPEAHTLDIDPDVASIAGASAAGVSHGLQTLRQLLPVEAFERVPARVPWRVPCVRIADAPRLRWRGALLDVGRHFMPKAFVLRFIDLLALHKLNTLHLHLTEDQGWRLEIHRYPRLTKVGAWRAGTMIGHLEAPGADPAAHDGVPHGGFYTQADIREIVAYAAARYVTVLPEIEMPGHAQAAIAAYPELGNTGAPVAVATGWGISEHVLNVEPATLDFCRGVLEEVLELFPGEFVHVGGDECPKAQWRASPAAQARRRELGLRDENELQSWFLTQIAMFLADHGRRMVGWDEILDGGPPPGATVMSWRGEEGGVTAARLGHDVVMAPGEYTYFDQYQTADRAFEPLAIGGLLDLPTVYAYEPVPVELTKAEAARVLGSQFQIWTEYIRTPAQVEYMAFPRACAFAEVAWSHERRAREFFDERLPVHVGRLDRLGVNRRRDDATVRPFPR